MFKVTATFCGGSVTENNGASISSNPSPGKKKHSRQKMTNEVKAIIIESLLMEKPPETPQRRFKESLLS